MYKGKTIKLLSALMALSFVFVGAFPVLSAGNNDEMQKTSKPMTRPEMMPLPTATKFKEGKEDKDRDKMEVKKIKPAPVVKMKRFKGKFEEIKDQYKKEVEYYKKSRNQLLRLKERRRKAAGAEEMRQINKEAKAYLLRIINVLVGKLEALKTWVSNRKAYSDEIKQKVISEIDEDISWLQEQAQKVENADELSPDDVRERAKEIREYWNKYRSKIKRLSGIVMAYRVETLVEKAENLADRVEEKIDVLKERGVDTSRLELWLEEFKTDIEKAKQKAENAKERFEGIDNASSADRFFREGHSMARDVLSMIREAHRELMSIIREMKQQARANADEEGQANSSQE